MRKQYHFRKSELGLLAWDIHRLIDLTKHSGQFEIPISEIEELNESYWFDEGSPTCKDLLTHMLLIEAADLSYPIILCPNGRLMDGMHRVAKAYLAGHTHIKAVQLQVLPEPDYVGVGPDNLPYDEV